MDPLLDRVQRGARARQKAGPLLIALHHLAVGSAEVEALAAFWREVVGLAEVKRHHTEAGELRSIWLALHPGVLMIEARSGEGRRRAVAGVEDGYFLLALTASKPERGALLARLRAAGAPEIGRTERTVYFADPDGNRFGVSSYSLGG